MSFGPGARQASAGRWLAGVLAAAVLAVLFGVCDVSGHHRLVTIGPAHQVSASAPAVPTGDFSDGCTATPETLELHHAVHPSGAGPGSGLPDADTATHHTHRDAAESPRPPRNAFAAGGRKRLTHLCVART
ncbi:hypothetical protein [Streptomyces xinghaiensis]|uniref:hypothetical protein n=1 Tax=Streptomyces xinghaiensis TaxID=1038928 RepID=UPI002E1364CF|nr:hypothetical protein OG463_25695 [Streptomyces xinghaiensis]